MEPKSSHLLVSLVFLLASTSFSDAAVININWWNAAGYEIKDVFKDPLSSGIQNLAGDGTAMELGYYSQSTLIDWFAGEWIPLTGPSALLGQTTTMGDKLPGVAGLFDITSSFNTTTRPSILGAVGHPLSIRFYDQPFGTTPDYYNAVSSSNWLLPSPPEGNGTMDFEMDLSYRFLVWEGGLDSRDTFRTMIPIPEPSSLLLIGFSSLGLFSRRRCVKN